MLNGMIFAACLGQQRQPNSSGRQVERRATVGCLPAALWRRTNAALSPSAASLLVVNRTKSCFAVRHQRVRCTSSILFAGCRRMFAGFHSAAAMLARGSERERERERTSKHISVARTYWQNVTHSAHAHRGAHERQQNAQKIALPVQRQATTIRATGARSTQH